VRGNPNRPASCHPDRPYLAKGLCNQCYEKGRRKRDPERKNAHNRKFSRANPHKVREYQRRYAYGIEPSEYEAMVAAQRGLCAICQQAKPLCVDHCHTTGLVRALLCKFCNLVMGRVDANPEFVQRLGAYDMAARELRARGGY
jgi:hypothetical protein